MPTKGRTKSKPAKRRAVWVLLKDEEWGSNSDRWVAEKAGVSSMFVGKLRKEATVNGLQSTERRGTDGRTINTANIGRTRPELTPPPSPSATTYRPPVTPDEPEEDDRPDYDPDAEDDGLELTAENFGDHLLTEAEIVNDEEEDDEPYIPPHVSNPQPSTFQVRKAPDPKYKEPPFVLWLTLLGKVRGQGHRSLIEALNSVENRTMGDELDVHVDDLIEMLRASKKQA